MDQYYVRILDGKRSALMNLRILAPRVSFSPGSLPIQQAKASRNSERLEKLVAAIRSEHAACQQATGDVHFHRVRCGELLIQAKELVAHNEWAGWAANTFGWPERRASLYLIAALGKAAERIAEEHDGSDASPGSAG
jgi:hypothetical protein